MPKDKIYAICDSLNKIGIRPTLERVRTELGGGSFSTINPVLKQWKEENQQNDYSLPDLPNEVTLAFNKAAVSVWKAANTHFSEMLQAARVETDRLIETANAEKEEAENEVKALERKNASLANENTRQSREITALTLQVSTQQLALDASVKAQEELKAEVKQLRKDLQASLSEASKLEGMLEALRDKPPVEKKPTARTKKAVQD